MKIHIIIDIPHIKDVDSEEADLALASVTETCEGSFADYDWFIDDATQETEDADDDDDDEL